jgi:hypothetical protein
LSLVVPTSGHCCKNFGVCGSKIGNVGQPLPEVLWCYWKPADADIDNTLRVALQDLLE